MFDMLVFLVVLCVKINCILVCNRLLQILCRKKQARYEKSDMRYMRRRDAHEQLARTFSPSNSRWPCSLIETSDIVKWDSLFLKSFIFEVSIQLLKRREAEKTEI